MPTSPLLQAVCPLGELPSRRRFCAGLATALAAPALAQDGVQGEVGRNSRFTQFVSAEQVETAAVQQYRQLLAQAAASGALAPPDHPQVQRLRFIAQRIEPFTAAWNPRARQWRWEVNLLLTPQLNAFCLPGGKIALYGGILQQLQLTDDEVATITGHEVAHALREHARERLGKGMATRGLIEIGSALLGLGNLGRGVAGIGNQLLSLQFSRSDETEADIVGMELAARAGYDPAAGVTLWRKMLSANKGAPPQWMSTHPAGLTRINDIESRLPRVLPLYQRAPRPARRFAPPPPVTNGPARP